jgi:hypothetical protein
MSLTLTSRAPRGRARSTAGRGRRLSLVLFVCAGAGLALGTASAQASFIGHFKPNPAPIATTVPPNGDVNPYGIVTVPDTVGSLVRGDELVSNFNDSDNLQGTGTTIVQIPPSGNNDMPGAASVFAQISDPECPGGVGLTTALTVTRTGYVIVGSLPTSDGMSDTAQAGCLIVLNSRGRVVETIAGGPINGPWDMAASDEGFFTTLYVTNVLNGTVAADTGGPSVAGNVVDRGTVVRIELLTIPGVRPIVLNEDVIATGFPERTDPSALVVGPTGDALAPDGTLYVADTQGNRIAAIPDAPFRVFPARHGGFTVSSGGDLNGPLGLTLAPNGDILTANGGDGNIVETTPFGAQTDIAADSSSGAGALFGLTVPPGFDGVYFVDDGDNSLRVLAP